MAETALSLLGRAEDPSSIRPFYTEWGVAEGNLEHWGRNTVLASLALQDLESLGPLLNHHCVTALTCLALALRRLWERRREMTFLAGLAAIPVLTDNMTLTAQQRQWQEDARSVAFANGAASPPDPAVAVRALGDAARAAMASIEMDFPHGMPPFRFRFENLRRLAENAQA